MRDYLTPYEIAKDIANQIGGTVRKIQKDEYAIYTEEEGWRGAVGYGMKQGIVNDYTELHESMIHKSNFEEETSDIYTKEDLKRDLKTFKVRQDDLAEFFGTDKYQVSRWKRGAKPIPDYMQAGFWLYFELKKLRAEKK